MKPIVVIFSQDTQFYLMLSHILEVDGFATAPVVAVDDALELAHSSSVGAILLDCRQGNQISEAAALLKRNPAIRDVEIVALLAPGSEDQQFDLIKAGVSERFVSPYVPRKLLDFLHETLRGRPGYQDAQFRDTVVYGDVEIDRLFHRVRIGGAEVPFGPIEYKILKHLVEYPGRVFSRNELIRVGWVESSDVDSRAVDVHVGQLRRLLRLHSSVVSIRTVRLAGYALNELSA
ncbi:winged-helix domain-containing protein [Mesorhizobium sp. IMUNJ 23232]|uniref:winged-helix domain-containing protein n=1 Tax=Mesorhizobium sp. IMUNJ 23232 TaxID=3376064 RepID=UPI0037B0F7CF